VVITPHAVERQYERQFNGGEILPWYTIHAVLQHDNPNQYVRVRGFQVYLNCKFNQLRNREEVEVISFTPDNWTRKDDICIMTVA
jgi:hypothetical protein